MAKRQQKSSTLRFVLVASLLGMTAFLLRARGRDEVIPKAEPIARFPSHVEQWGGQDQTIAVEIRAVLGPGEFLSRSYSRSPEEPSIDLFLAYFPSQQQGDTIHSPRNCLPGSGWTLLESAQIELPIVGRVPMRINRNVIAKGYERELVLYWYQAHGRAVASEYWAKFYLVTDAIRMHRTDGALVRVITPVQPREGTEAAQLRAETFATAIAPTLSRYIPD